MTTTANIFPRAAILIVAILGVAILGAGYFIGNGPAKFKTATRTVTVKGLADREVVSDFVIWTLQLRRAGGDVTAPQVALKRDRDRLIQFLNKQGIVDAEIERVPISSQDRQATHYAVVTTPKDSATRYIASATLVVRSTKVDVVRSALGQMDELMLEGLTVSGGREDGRSNVVYRYTKFNDLRPELISDATKNARASAERFAADSAKKVGAIRSAQQGLIQIFGEEGNDEGSGFVSTSYRKKTRVVNTIEFDLVD